MLINREIDLGVGTALLLGGDGPMPSLCPDHIAALIDVQLHVEWPVLGDLLRVIENAIQIARGF